jgi:signal peptidase II
MTSADASPAEVRAPRSLFWATVAIALVVILVDQLSKWWAERALSDGKRIPVVGDVIQFWLVYNPGAAFSIGTGSTWIFAILAAAAVVVIGWLALRVGSKGWMVALGLLLGGAATHLGDRLFRAPGFGRGHVVDFIDYAGFFIGNIADIAIFGGVVMLVILMFRGIRLRGGRGSAS